MDVVFDIICHTFVELFVVAPTTPELAELYLEERERAFLAFSSA
jgi:hypothetical protein